MWVTKTILNFCKGMVVFLVPSMTVIVFLQVVLRYLLNESLTWVEELARYMLVWIACLGSVYAVRKGLHVSINLIRKKLNGTTWKVFSLVLHLFVLFLYYFAIKEGVQYTLDSRIVSMASMPFSMATANVIVPIGFSLMAICEVELLYFEMKYGKDYYKS